MRIQKLLADLLGISRRNSDQLVLDGRVEVNNRLIEPGFDVNPETDSISLDGVSLTIKPKTITNILFHKPAGYVTTRWDPMEMRTIYTILPPSMKNLFPVGRLDKETEGLLILTNDGQLCYRLTHPKFEIEKEYYVEVFGLMKPSELARVEEGIDSDLIKASPTQVRVEKFLTEETHLFITLKEGQNREVRKIFQSVGHKVKYLRRVRIGKLQLGNLEVGKYRALSQEDLNLLV